MFGLSDGQSLPSKFIYLMPIKKRKILLNKTKKTLLRFFPLNIFFTFQLRRSTGGGARNAMNTEEALRKRDIRFDFNQTTK